MSCYDSRVALVVFWPRCWRTAEALLLRFSLMGKLFPTPAKDYRIRAVFEIRAASGITPSSMNSYGLYS